MLVALGVVCYSQRKIARSGAKEMKNGLIVSIPIGHYYNAGDGDIPGDFPVPDLPVHIDAQNMKNLADDLNYNFLTIDGKLKWTENEIMDFMKNKVGEEFFDAEGTPKYDGLIVSISGHGVRSHIVSSDGKVIDRTVIHRCVSNAFPKIRQFPRIFIFDACDGEGDRRDCTTKIQNVQSVDSQSREGVQIIYEEAQKGDMQQHVEVQKRMELEDVQKEDEWTKSSKNPDYNLITVHASNPGFVAKMNTSEEVGSYLTYFFAKKVTENAKKAQNKELADIMDEIEMKLHDAGKQQIRMEFFTQTRKLRIKRNEAAVNATV